MQRIPVTIFFILFVVAASLGQSLDELRRQKQSASEIIEYTNELLNKVGESHKVTLNKLRLINRQIEQRRSVISTINSEISVVQSLINDNTLVVEMLKKDLEKIKEEYALMVRYAYMNRTAYNTILFFLSAENFNQAYRRFVYVRQYAEYRQRQAQVITAMQNILRQKTADLENRKADREELAKQQAGEARKLDSERRQQNTAAQQLQKQQQELRNQLAQQRRIEQQLEREIQRIIAEEVRKTPGAASPGFALTPEQKLTGDSFEQNRRRLPWPVERGVITEKFGVHPHPSLKNVTVNNNGVNITTGEGTKARAVFNGEVSRVFGITGGNMAVIIRHGQYLTVYSNLVDVTVKKGDNVSVKQNIGTIYSGKNDGNKAVLKFQIWKESQKLNPEEWLVK